MLTLEGSRTNVNIPEDEFQDFDFSYFVTDMDFFKKSDDWLNYFGERIIVFRPNLLTMLRWRVGIDTQFSLSIGKSDKFLKKYVSGASWNTLLFTYKMGSYQEMWDSLYTSFELFRETAQFVAGQLGYSYPDYDDKVKPYIDGIYEKYTRPL